MYESFKPASRRMRMLRVTPQLLLNAMISPLLDGNRIRAITVDGLPEGVEIQGVLWDDYRYCFAFRLVHPSWDEVPEYSLIPEIELRFTAHDLLVQSDRTVTLMPTRPSGKLMIIKDGKWVERPEDGTVTEHEQFRLERREGVTVEEAAAKAMAAVNPFIK